MQKGIEYSAGGVAWNRVFTISVQIGKVSEGHPQQFGFPPPGAQELLEASFSTSILMLVARI